MDEHEEEEKEIVSHRFERQSFFSPSPEATEVQDRRVLRTYDAVLHEWRRQTDKKIIEELGIFAE